MTVYIDRAMIPFRGMKMSHLMADASEELDAMALRIGLRPEWKQGAGTYREHYDVSESRRQHAIRLGAVQVDSRELVMMRQRKRKAELRVQAERAKLARRLLGL